MKLLLLVLAASCPLLASALSFFDLINPFAWLFNAILNTGAVCDVIDSALENAIVRNNVYCDCTSFVNVFLFFPIGATASVQCYLDSGSIELNNQKRESNQKLQSINSVTLANRLHAIF